MSGIQTHNCMMGTDCTDSCKPNYHTITTTTAPGIGNIAKPQYEEIDKNVEL